MGSEMCIRDRIRSDYGGLGIQMLGIGDCASVIRIDKNSYVKELFSSIEQKLLWQLGKL